MTAIASLAVSLTLLLLVGLLLVVQNKLAPHGDVSVTINEERQLTVEAGSTLANALGAEGIHLPSACGGKGNCGQCRCRIVKGAGEALPIEKNFFNRKEVAQGWRLGCQTKVRGDMAIAMPQSVLNAKEYECTVVSNRNVATFIKEFKVALPPGEHIDFTPGSYAQIHIPAFDVRYADYDRELIGIKYLPAWEKMGLFGLRCKNSEPTVRAYSMANYPDEGDIFMLTVRIATPPLKPDRSGFLNVNPGIASSYIFSLRPGDKVTMTGPFGEFHVEANDTERIWVGGGAGMAPLRSQIMHLTRTLHDRSTPMHYFYGARALDEVFYLDDFLTLQKEFGNFHFHLALDRPDPSADAAGVEYTPGFVHQVMYDTYLCNHPCPEDIHYYMCGPGPMSNAVTAMLDNLGVPPQNISYDNFGNNN
ncbi:MAG: NADH:ubiquinone reductase (Na(+)-transporting) subunit F [Bacteroidales bacterium]|nr:NADH:ubiquinone reductase (Na(+)-transporting) subunit F [Bacteroidales bacterium]